MEAASGVAVTVAGDVETFDAAEFRLRLAVALDGAVEPATIEVEAGSVRVEVTLWTADEASAADATSSRSRTRRAEIAMSISLIAQLSAAVAPACSASSSSPCRR